MRAELRLRLEDSNGLRRLPLAVDQIGLELAATRKADMMPPPFDSDLTRPGEFFDCFVCSEKKRSNEIAKLSCSSAHEKRGYCRTCIMAHVDSRIVEKLPLVCPDEMCRIGQELGYFEIKSFASKKLFEDYDTEMAEMAIISGLPNFRYCPWPDCRSGQEVVGGASNPIISCQKCKRKFCFIHKGRWHEGGSCFEPKKQ